MQNVYVQWTDNTATAVLSVFGGAQDKESYPNQAVIASDDPRYETFYKAMPVSIQSVLIAPGE